MSQRMNNRMRIRLLCVSSNCITGHQGLLNKGYPGYNESRFNVLVEWETGESTYEPLDVIAADDPITCAIYAKEKGLLNEPGWQCFKSIARRENRLL